MTQMVWMKVEGSTKTGYTKTWLNKACITRDVTTLNKSMITFRLHLYFMGNGTAQTALTTL